MHHRQPEKARSPAFAITGALLMLLPALLSAQSGDRFGGVWVLDPSRRDAGDVYGELRVVEASNRDVRVTMVDYGSAWTQGAFRGVVRFVPWTFPHDRWAPRRGPEESQQPLARARRAAGKLVLAKATAHGNGDFVWVWSHSPDGQELLHQGTDQRWDADFEARPAEGKRIHFRRAAADDSLSEVSLRGRLSDLAGSIPVTMDIIVRLSPAGTAFLVSCPHQECRVVELESGVEVNSRPLRMGSVGVIPLHSEARIEPHRLNPRALFP
jgi:hypothetical protein